MKIKIYSFSKNFIHISLSDREFTDQEIINDPQNPAEKKFTVWTQGTAESKEFIARIKDKEFSYDINNHTFAVKRKSKPFLEGLLNLKNPFSRIFLNQFDEIYGFGARPGDLCRRDKKFILLNKDTMFYADDNSSYSSFPFFLIRRSGKFTGIFLNVVEPLEITIDQDGKIFPRGAIGFNKTNNSELQTLEILIFFGSLKKIIKNFTKITGRPFLPPLWSLGYHQSRWSYKSQDAIIDIARKFREKKLPLDAINLDIHYMDKFKVFTWDQKNFPKPRKLHRVLDSMGIKTVAIVDPGIATAEKYPVYQEGKENNYFCKKKNGDDYVGTGWPGKVSFPDFTRSEVRDWWAKCHKELLDTGVSGIWNDMNDPVLRMNPLHNPLNEDIHHDGKKHYEVRNIYANLEAQATWKAFKIYRPGKRPFILSRSGYPGIQKFSALWTGDNFSSWDQLRENLYMVLNLGLSGVSFCGADIGGFGGSKGLKGIVKVKKNKELFVRWFELGSLMPFFRVHTTLISPQVEPWSFGPVVEKQIEKHLKRRYSLLPYIYALFFKSYKSGLPIIRPLFYRYKNIPKNFLEKQFLLGPALLACPVLEEGKDQIEIFLPKGNWYEYESGKKFIGNGLFQLETPLGYYPLFIKEGSIIPKAQVRRNAESTFFSDTLILELYPGKEIKGLLYIDDGDTTKMEKGDYTLISFKGRQLKNKRIQLKSNIKRNRSKLHYKHLELKVHGKYQYLNINGNIYKGHSPELSEGERNFSMKTFEIPINKFFEKKVNEIIIYTDKHGYFDKAQIFEF